MWNLGDTDLHLANLYDLTDIELIHWSVYIFN